MFNDLETKNIESIKTKPSRQGGNFPCMKCSGTGNYTFGYVNRQTGKCHACNGRGFFKTSPEYRKKSRLQAASRKVRNQAQAEIDALEELKLAHPAVGKWIETGSQRGNGFASSLLKGAAKYGSLTPKQIGAVYKILEKDDQSARDERGPAACIDMSQVQERFQIARSAGLKAPKLRLEKYTFVGAKAGTKNAGHIFVKESPGTYGTRYLGKINPDGEFYRARDCRDDDLEELKKITSDILDAVRVFGSATGCCSFCNRDLVDPVSVALSYGPICADNWGLSHDEDSARAINPDVFEAKEALRIANDEAQDRATTGDE